MQVYDKVRITDGDVPPGLAGKDASTTEFLVIGRSTHHRKWWLLCNNEKKLGWAIGDVTLQRAEADPVFLNSYCWWHCEDGLEVVSDSSKLKVGDTVCITDDRAPWWGMSHPPNPDNEVFTIGHIDYDEFHDKEFVLLLHKTWGWEIEHDSEAKNLLTSDYHHMHGYWHDTDGLRKVEKGDEKRVEPKFSIGDEVVVVSLPDEDDRHSTDEKGEMHSSMVARTILSIADVEEPEEDEDEYSYHLNNGYIYWEHNLEHALVPAPPPTQHPAFEDGRGVHHKEANNPKTALPSEREAKMKRYVHVVVVDPENTENLPLDKQVLLSDGPLLTDSTDQEIFMELDMAGLLKKHNELRKKTLDVIRSAEIGREIYLRPRVIGELVCRVIEVARIV